MMTLLGVGLAILLLVFWGLLHRRPEPGGPGGGRTRRR